MKVGDLVRIQTWCVNKGRIAIIARVEPWDSTCVWIRYLDGNETTAPSAASRKNLIVLNEN
jgi:hypothetical protein